MSAHHTTTSKRKQYIVIADDNRTAFGVVESIEGLASWQAMFDRVMAELFPELSIPVVTATERPDDGSLIVHVGSAVGELPFLPQRRATFHRIGI